MAASNPRIGALRWPVLVVLREQIPEPGGSITELKKYGQMVRADVQPLGPMTFFASEATDTPTTTRIYIRWVDWLDTRHAVIRETRRRDGSVRTETYRVRKVAEVEGRKRYTEILAELERSV